MNTPRSPLKWKWTRQNDKDVKVHPSNVGLMITNLKLACWEVLVTSHKEI